MQIICCHSFPGKFPAILSIVCLIKLAKFLNSLFFQEAAINTAVVIEVACWFFIGECIGKGGLIGYDV